MVSHLSSPGILFWKEDKRSEWDGMGSADRCCCYSAQPPPLHRSAQQLCRIRAAQQGCVQLSEMTMYLRAGHNAERAALLLELLEHRAVAGTSGAGLEISECTEDPPGGASVLRHEQSISVGCALRRGESLGVNSPGFVAAAIECMVLAPGAHSCFMRGRRGLADDGWQLVSSLSLVRWRRRRQPAQAAPHSISPPASRQRRRGVQWDRILCEMPTTICYVLVEAKT